jgi:hypothetical protein
VRVFEITGLSQILKQSLSMPKIASQLHIKSEELKSCTISDLAAAYAVVPDDKVVVSAIAGRFFEFTPAYVEKKFLNRPHSRFFFEKLQTVVRTFVLDATNLGDDEAKRIHYALILLQSGGIVMRDKRFSNRLATLSNESFDLAIYYLLTYGYDASVWSVLGDSTSAISSPLRMIDLCQQLRIVESDDIVMRAKKFSNKLQDTKLVLSIRAGLRASDRDPNRSLQAIFNRRWNEDKVSIRNFVDSVNWCLVAGTNHKRMESVIQNMRTMNPLVCEGWAFAGLRALRVRSLLTATAREVVENLLAKTIRLMSLSHVLDLFEYACMTSYACIEEICRRLEMSGDEAQGADIARLVRVLSYKKLDSVANDKVFQMIQGWLVPRICELGLAEIEAITSSIEAFGARPSAPSTCCGDESSHDSDIMTPMGFATASQ